MLKAVIFDFDGVITDSEVLHFRSFNEILAPFGVCIETEDYYKKYLGLSDKDLFQSLISEHILEVPQSYIDKLVGDKKKVYEHLAQTEGQIIEGVRPFLNRLAGHDIPMAICSGALLSEIEMILEQTGLRCHFKVIVSADQVKKSKPHPEGFHLTLQRLRQAVGPMEPHECVVVEDSHWGLNAAKAAGMHPVAVTNSYSADQLAMAELVVKRVDALTIEKLETLCR